MQLRVVAIALAILVGCSSSKKKSSGDDEPKVAGDAAAESVVRVGPETPAPELIELVGSYEETRLDSLQGASKACKLLAGSKAPGAREAVLAAATTKLDRMSPAHAVRKSCARALGSFDGEDIATALLTIAEDTSDQRAVRIGALDGLRQQAPASAAEHVVSVMIADGKLVDSARLVLVAIGEPAVAPLLKALAGEGVDEASKGSAAFAAARALGDMRTPAAVPGLIASLGKPPMPALVSRKGEAGMTHHIAVIEALRKIGGDEAANTLVSYARKSKDFTLGTPAYDAYGFVARGEEQAKALLAVVRNDGVAPNLRISSGLAVARVARTAAVAEQLRDQAKKFAAGGDATKRLFLTSAGLIARAEIGVECAGDAACFAKVLREPDEPLSTRLAAKVPSADTLSDGARRELAQAARERALIGLGRLGASARGELQGILGGVASTHRLVHLAAVDALVRVAERPCPSCVKALDEASAALATDKRPAAAQMLLDTEAARLVLGR